LAVKSQILAIVFQYIHKSTFHKFTQSITHGFSLKAEAILASCITFHTHLKTHINAIDFDISFKLAQFSNIFHSL
jgi:hypothetical protein